MFELFQKFGAKTINHFRKYMLEWKSILRKLEFRKPSMNTEHMIMSRETLMDEFAVLTGKQAT